MSEPFTPEQEARIREIVRELLQANSTFLDRSLSESLDNLTSRRRSGAESEDEHQVIAVRTPETLKD